MRILHTPIEIAGQLGLTVEGLRRIDLKADSLVYKHPFGYQNDFYFEFFESQEKRRQSRRDKLNFINENYDVIHYSYGTPILHDYEDVEFFLNENKKVFVEFWGSEVRIPSIESKRNKYYINSYKEIEHENIERMKRWSEFTNGVAIFSDHTFNDFLAPYFDKIHIIGQRVDTDFLQPVYPNLEEKKELIIAHAPSQQAFKGTKYVLKAIENLKCKGYKFKFSLIENKSHREAIDLYKQADIIIDQLCGGAHGVFACEAMALGKPVICYILDEHLEGYPKGFPIINANPDNIENVLKYWIETSPKERNELGMRSRKYAEEVHDIKVVARKLKKIYSKY